MFSYRSLIRQLFLRLILLLLVYQVLRLVFLLFNFKYFSGEAFFSFLSLFAYSVRFDVSTIIISNAPVIFLHLFPFRFATKKYFRLTIHILFIAINTIAITFNCIDMAYFRFTFKRSTWNIFHVMEVTTDLGNLIVRFLIDYWYLVSFFIILLSGFIYFSKKIFNYGTHLIEFSMPIRIVTPFIIIGLSILTYRGGIQLKPISIITAGQYTTPNNFPVLLNTTFTIIKTAEKEELPELDYMTDQQMLLMSKPVKQFSGKKQELNVVLIILESFSKEYIGAMNGLGVTYTPFLDSLISESLLITNTYANGKMSIEGIPAVTAGIPSLMDEPYISSPYAGNKITSIANLLNTEGYKTSFFHGGTNGTMGIDAFAKMAGYNSYYGRKEYNNDKDFDGKWGIYDEPYLRYYAKQLDGFKSPFFSTVFTLSSHHPYTIPDRHKNKFKDGPIPILKSIQYADYSLSVFFETIKKMDFYNNTLFVITADHTGEAFTPFYLNRVGSYQIPLLFFCPALNLKGKREVTSQQIDILPSVMDLLKYEKPFFSFGQSVFEEENHYAVNYISSSYQYLEDSMVTYFDGKNLTGTFNFVKDSTLQQDLKKPKNKSIEQAKAFIQLFNNSLIHNKMTADEK